MTGNDSHHEKEPIHFPPKSGIHSDYHDFLIGVAGHDLDRTAILVIGDTPVDIADRDPIDRTLKCEACPHDRDR